MKKKLMTLGLALGLAFGAITPIQDNITYASSIADSVDPTYLEYKVAAAKQLLKKYPKTISGDLRVELERLIKDSEAIIEEAYAFKAKYAVDNSLGIRVKNQIRANLDKRSSKFTVNVNAYTDNKQITDWFLDTAKEDWYFYYSMYDRANVSTKYNPKKAKDGKVFVESVTFTIKYRADVESESMVENFANQWVAINISPYDSDYDKAKKIHDFIATSNQYNRGDSKQLSGGYSIYHPASIIYGNGGVCNAYATLFDKLGTKAGLDVRYATGTSKKTGEPHIWNMVKVDGNWYNIDVTWDDPTISFSDGYVDNIHEFVIYDYFLKNDKEMMPSREIDKDTNRPQGLTTMNRTPKNATIEKVNGSYRVIR